MGERAAHVVIFAAARCDQLLKFRNDFFPAAVARVVHAVAVMDFLSAVQRKHDIAAFTVCKINDIVVDQQAVGCERKAEILARFLFNTARIGDQILDHLKIHQRFAAEEIDLQIPARTGIGDQKIQRLLADLKAHDRTLAVIFALACKAVGAVQIAGVRNMQAERLDNARGLFLQFTRHRLKRIRREQLSGVLQCRDIVIAFSKLLRGDLRVAAVFFLHGRDHRIPRVILIHRDHVICKRIDSMHRAGADVQHNVVAAELILMNHVILLFLRRSLPPFS